MQLRTRILSIALAALMVSGLTAHAGAQPRKDSAVLAMTLEPTGLDPTAGAASAIAEITLYNIYETLTKINADSRTTPLLAESWSTSLDLKVWTFKLRRDARFHNGEPFKHEQGQGHLQQHRAHRHARRAHGGAEPEER
jgi:peptide/nickel transport system substrate-binding protein